MDLEMERAVIRIGDVAVLISSVDSYLTTKDYEHAQRAAMSLEEIFSKRYADLRRTLYRDEKE